MKEILDDDYIEENVTIEEDGELTDDEFHKLWTDHMHDFEPDDILNIVI